MLFGRLPAWRGQERRRRKRLRVWLLPLAALLPLALVVAIAGGITYLSARDGATQSAQDNLEAIARLQAGQLESRLQAIMGDGVAAVASPLFIRELEAWLAGGRKDGTRLQGLVDQLKSLADSHRYLAISLRQAGDGRLLFSSRGAAEASRPDLLTLADIGPGETVIDDRAFARGEGRAVDLLFGVSWRNAKDLPTRVIVDIQVDPGAFLLPLLNRWPESSPSAETLLLKGSGDRVAYLSRPHYRAPDESQLLLPVAESSVLAAQAVAGKLGGLSGTDYRGVLSVGYALAVADTPWLLVTKVDATEVYAELNRLTILVAASTALIFLLAWWWMVERGRYMELRYRRVVESKMMSARLDFLAKHANDCIVLADLEGRILEVNDRLLTTYGYTRDELLAMNVADLHPPQMREELRQQRRALLKQGAVFFESRHGRRDGSVFPVEVSCRLIDMDGRRYIQAIVRDISERKRQEEEQRLQAERFESLSRRLLAVQEEERRRLAGDLHDRASPNLAAIKLILASLPQAYPEHLQGELAATLDDAQALLDDTTTGIREICADLRPTLLDYAGLVPTLEGYAQMFSKRTGIKVKVKKPRKQLRPERDVESMLFRVAQEALTNCTRHACAKHVDIDIGLDRERLYMTIRDDGFGFDPETLGKSGQPPGLGLITMRERVEFAGGRFSVISHPLRGTEIRVELQYRPGVDLQERTHPLTFRREEKENRSQV
ncbi:MAG TPA: PAS domain S-box protein [Azospira sp.]|nr:PAS domain S-box protein [Azospira sp.]